MIKAIAFKKNDKPLVVMASVSSSASTSTSVTYKKNALSSQLHSELQTWLLTQQYFNGLTRKGKPIDRKQIWFHRTGDYFNPKWNGRYSRWEGRLFPSILDRVLDELGQPELNSCLVNYYEDGQSFIPLHIDSVEMFGSEPTIVNLSIGATRTLHVINDDTKTAYPLEDNSVLVMSGPSVPHEILRDDNCKTARWSLTFRQHRSELIST